MSLQRENILDLIGSRRYHSAILTTFSFDFFFFEMKAMKWLRSCGIRNVNVLMDGYYYSELMQQMGGEEMKLSPGYSLYPMFNKSLFHPKIWMLFGEKEALLIIGSGNLTNSGNGNNEEIWGAFHFDIQNTENAALFSTAWSYVQQLCSSVQGFTHEKTTRWIIDHAKWLSELPKANPAKFLNVNGKEQIAFLSNTVDSTIWQQLVTLIGNEDVVEITTLSPFYDKKGKAIEALSILYPRANLYIVVDESGAIPELLPESKANTFYDWYNVGISKAIDSKSEYGGANSKLHAKIIHFKTKVGKEFCLFGSANVTPEGLGLEGAMYNSEVSLLVSSLEGGLLKRLGINLKSPVELSVFNINNKTSIYDSIIKSNRFKIKLLSAELVYNELHIYAGGSLDLDIVAKLFDRENRLLYTLKLGSFAFIMKSKVDVSFQEVHTVQLFDDESDSVVSNKVLLSDYNILAKTHPNPKTEDIERICNEIYGGELLKVLDLLHYATSDATESDNSANALANKGNQTIISQEKQGPDQLYDLSSYKAIEHNSLEKSLLNTSISLRVLDALKFIRTNNFEVSTKPETKDDEQEVNLDNLNGEDEKEIQKERNFSLAILKSERKKLLDFFNNLSKHQQFLIYPNKKQEEYKPTLTDLSKYLIALELMLQFGGKSEKYVEDEKEFFYTYLNPNGEKPYHFDSIKGCSLNIIGGFLMMVRSGYKEYDFEYTQNKIAHLQTEALISTLICILNTRWKEFELPYFNSMLLNCLHYMGEKNLDIFKDFLPEMKKRISEKIKSLKYPSQYLDENIQLLERKIIPAFINTKNQILSKDFDSISEKGIMIYRSPWGYCLVKDVSKQNEFSLIRPGFLWSEKLGEFIRHSNDVVYKPLLLKTFINVRI